MSYEHKTWDLELEVANVEQDFPAACGTVTSVSWA